MRAVVYMATSVGYHTSGGRQKAQVLLSALMVPERDMYTCI